MSAFECPAKSSPFAFACNLTHVYCPYACASILKERAGLPNCPHADVESESFWRYATIRHYFFELLT